MAHGRRILGLFLLLPLAAACAGVLGIEDAEFDPSLEKVATGTGGKSGEAGGPGDLCDDYCDAVQKNCNAEFEVYISREVCVKVCQSLPPGTRGDDAGNSAACRLHYAESAGTVGEKDVNCPFAGPGGNGACGTNCEGFCSIALASCNADFLSLSQCTSLCTRIDVDPPDGSYTDKMKAGATVQCRLYHVSAATIDPVVHCPHAAGIGVGPCTPAPPGM